MIEPDTATAFLAERMQARIGAGERYARDNAVAMAQCAAAMADRFFAGATLLVVGEGVHASDAEHNAVEYVHPVLPGCRALPALSISADTVSLLGRRGDILLTFGDAPEALRAARERDMLTVALLDGDATSRADHTFAAHTDDALVAQELHLATYHILWELVHIALNHRGIADVCVTCADELARVRIEWVGLDGTSAGGPDGEVDVQLLDEVQPGDVVLAQGGVALQRATAEAQP